MSTRPATEREVDADRSGSEPAFTSVPQDAPVTRASPSAFHAMAKPIGPICNIDCRYCFYLEKESLYPDVRKWRMPDDVLEAFVRQYIEQQHVPEVTFAWQGGEPTLLGVPFFRKVVELQRRYAGGKAVHNAIQTNGTLLDDDWGAFLAAEHFLVGLSVDGPRDVHDRYRVDKQGRGTFDGVVRGLDVLGRHGVEFNTLTVVGRHNQDRGNDVYRFLKRIGSTFIQFIPLVERETGAIAGVPLTVGGKPVAGDRHAHALAGPPDPGGAPLPSPPVTAWSVEPHAYGRFLCEAFDEWVRRDVGRVFVQLFDVALGQWSGAGSSLCVFAETCGSAVAVEHNGDVYSCDHYVYPQYKLGNLTDRAIAELIASPRQQRFGSDKRDALPAYCRKCDVRFACNGECPKHRFATTPDGEPGLNYLCAAYKRFFHHVDPYMRTMADLLHRGRAPAEIMRLVARPRSLRGEVAAVASGVPCRNDQCPCGSGQKHKRCCGRG